VSTFYSELKYKLSIVRHERRIALHQYDPKDLSSDLNTEPENNKEPAHIIASATHTTESLKEKSKYEQKTVQDEQIAQASTKGLQVDFAVSCESKDQNETSRNDGGFVDCTNEGSDEIERWEKGHEEDELVDFDDSDDDLL